MGNTISRKVCYQALEWVGCIRERQIQLFHEQLAHLVGKKRTKALVKLATEERKKNFPEKRRQECNSNQSS